MKSYRVAYERDESGWWVATVRGVRGCHTQGRTVDEARPRIRETLELFVANARRAPIVDDVKLPSAATRAIRAYTTLRKKARPRIANRKPKDERARCRSSPGAVTSARTPTHARREYPVDSARVPEDGSRTQMAERPEIHGGVGYLTRPR